MMIDLNIPIRAGVFRIFNTNTNTHIIIATKDIILYILNMMKAIEYTNRHIDPKFIQAFRNNQLTLECLEDAGKLGSLARNIRLTYHLNRFRKLGWSEYTHQRQGTRLSVVKRLIKQKDMGYKVFVMLKPSHTNSPKSFPTVGVFDDMKSADRFIEQYYPHKNIYVLTTALNELTRIFLSSN